MAKHSMGLTSQPSKSLAEMAVESFNNEQGDYTGYDCPVCKNKGLVAFLKDGTDLYRQCECVSIRHAMKIQADSGIEMLLDKYRFDNYEVTEPWQQYTVEKAKEFTEKKDGWFFIGGKTGTGKTHICTAIVDQLLKDRIPCKYMMWKDEARILKAMVNDSEYATLIRPLKETKCLYIDDFLQDGTTTGSMNLAFEILNHRYNNGLLTIISSELTVQDILEAREAVGGRIYEKARNYMIQIKNGQNYRLKGVRA